MHHHMTIPPAHVHATRFGASPDLNIAFPPLPCSMVEVADLISTAGDIPDTPRLIQVVQADPIIATSVLRRVNSAYYGLRRPTGDIEKAVMLLGFGEVCNLVLAAGMMKLQDLLNKEQQVIFDHAVKESLGTAFFAQELARFVEMPNRGIAFSAGLLHNIGRLVLLYNRAEDYEALWFTQEYEQSPPVETERIIFGTDHMELGTLAALEWNLPTAIATVIQNYVDPTTVPDGDDQLLGWVVAAGVAATRRVLAGEEADPDPSYAIYALSEALQFPVVDILEQLHLKHAIAPEFIASMTSC